MGVAVETLRRRGHRMAVASQSPLARVRMSLQVAGLAGSSVSTSTSPRWWRVPNPRPISIYLPPADSAPRPRTASSSRIRRPALPRRSPPACAPWVTRLATPRDAMRASGAQVIRSMDELIAADRRLIRDQRVSGCALTPRGLFLQADSASPHADIPLSLRDFAPSDGAMARPAPDSPLSGATNNQGIGMNRNAGARGVRVARRVVVCMRRWR